MIEECFVMAIRTKIPNDIQIMLCQINLSKWIKQQLLKPTTSINHQIQTKLANSFLEDNIPKWYSKNTCLIFPREDENI